ncbi:hypothetical protein C8Q76DRAFT_792251 [Earliella scabrosa]|nr:hypothetical protein C8Q76DRAFT_792251 [Earliella scabrosa]
MLLRHIRRLVELGDSISDANNWKPCLETFLRGWDPAYCYKYFGATYHDGSTIPTLFQAGCVVELAYFRRISQHRRDSYAVGLLCICPLGDLVRRRPLILLTFSASHTMGLPVTSSLPVFDAPFLLVGICSGVSQVLMPDATLGSPRPSPTTCALPLDPGRGATVRLMHPMLILSMMWSKVFTQYGRRAVTTLNVGLEGGVHNSSIPRACPRWAIKKYSLRHWSPLEGWVDVRAVWVASGLDGLAEVRLVVLCPPEPPSNHHAMTLSSVPVACSTSVVCSVIPKDR